MGLRYLTTLIAIVLVLTGCNESPNEIINNYYLSDSLANPNVMPRVIFTNPADGEIGPFDDYLPSHPPIAQLTIQFNKLINVLNLKESTITLKTGDEFDRLVLVDYYNGTYKDPLVRSILIFKGSRYYVANRVYTVTIDSTLVDVHGNKLGKPYSFSFTPEPKFRIYFAYPLGGQIEPEYTSWMSITFNSKIDSATLTKLSISPAINGNWLINPYGSYYYTDSTTAYFRLKDTLLFDTKYTMSVAADTRDAQGLVIKEPYQLSFTTSPFRVFLYSTSYSSNYYSLSFEFNGSVDTSTVLPAITITPAVPFTLTYYVNYFGQFRDVNVNLQNLPSNTTYQVTIDTTVRSAKGVYMRNPYTYSFTTSL